MRRLLGTIIAGGLLALAGCHTCDVCDDCGDGGGCGCGSRSYHARTYGDPGYAPGYVAPVSEGTIIGKNDPNAKKVKSAKSQVANKMEDAKAVR